MADIEKVIAKGDRHRSVANTVMNTNRYRSILISLSLVFGPLPGGDETDCWSQSTFISLSHSHLWPPSPVPVPTCC